MSLPIKKRSQIHAALRAALAAAPALAGVHIVLEDFSAASEKAQETALRDTGTIIVIQPILRQLLTEKISTASIKSTAEIAVWLRQNAERNAEQPAPRDHDDTLDAILLALHGLGITPGRPAGVVAPAQEFSALIPEDRGLLTTALYFTVDLITTR